jgi:penicillin-binding protein 1A
MLLISGAARLLKPLLSILAGIILLITAVALGVYIYFAQDLPEITDLEDYKPEVISEVFASDGTKIGEFWTECRIFTPYDEIPDRVKQAFIDSEDARFFEHSGVDMRSIARAFVANLKAGTIKQGGSTITQQITRSLLLSREKKISRKAKEAILATRLERHLSKRQILTLYLNQIFLGNRAYGIAAAARNYYHMPLDELSLGQIALLAGLPTAPTNFSPINNPKIARQKQLHVLGRMMEEDHITSDEAKHAADESFTIYIAGIDKTFNDRNAAYFVEYVRRIVKERYGDDVLYHKGLKIYSTVDLPMQTIGTQKVRRAIEALDRRHGWKGPVEKIGVDEISEQAALITRSIWKRQSGGIILWPPKNDKTITLQLEPNKPYRAIVLGFEGTDTSIIVGNIRGKIKQEHIKWARPYSTKHLGQPDGNYIKKPQKIFSVGDMILVRILKDGNFALTQEPTIQAALLAIDPHTGFVKTMVGGYDFDKSEFNRSTQAMRQPGSAFKPFVYAAALDKGYTYGTEILDEPVVYQVGRHEFWSPKNYGSKFKGVVPLSNALRFSRNIPTVKVTFDIGTHYLTGFVRKMGITSPLEKYLSMSLGANAVYLDEMVQAYTVFVNEGKLTPVIAITKILDSNGHTIEDIHVNPANQSDIISPLLAKPVPGVEDEPVRSALDTRGVDEEDLNIELFKRGTKDIKKDDLVLTELEIKTLYGKDIPDGHVITPQTAYLMTNLLKGVVEGGTGSKVRELKKPVGGKTGTTNNETDVWFIGFVPDLVTGVWIGFDELRPIGKRITGGNTAAPLFLDFMKSATEGWEAKDFTRPTMMSHGELSTLAGGSALFGARPSQQISGTRGSSDRAGMFFEEDLEYDGTEEEEESPPVKQAF